MRKNAIIYEPWAKGVVHYQFIKCFLIMISECYDEVIFIGHDSLVLKLKNECFKGVSFYSINIVNFDSKIGKLFSYIKESQNVKFLKKISFDCDIFITYTVPYTLFWCKKLLLKNPIYYVMHGGFEYFSKKLLPTNYFFYLRKEVCKMQQNANLIVLGDSIKNNIINNFIGFKNRILSIEHPYLPFKNTNNKVICEEKSKLKIGTVGCASIAKGNLSIMKIFDFLLSKNVNSIELYHIGKIPKELNILEKYISTPLKSEELIGEDEFNSEISKLDYCLYLYPSDTYKFTASGALFDALVHSKPIIALKNDYFEYFFNKFPGIGFLYDSIEELCEGLLVLPLFSSDEYKKMVEKCKITLNSVSPYILKESFLIEMKKN